MPTAAKESKEATGAAEAEASNPTTVLVGLDWGTNASCLMAAEPGKSNLLRNSIIPSVVGYAKEGLLEGILPNNRTTLFGAEALKHYIHLSLVRPLRNGVIAEPRAARDYAAHLKTLLDLPSETQVWAVIGVPARADAEARENARNAIKGIFDKVILIPEPFLAALGYRDETKLGEPAYIDPVNNSLFIDIGAGSTDLCLVQGYYPQGDDQLTIPFAGDAVDASLARQIAQKYPDCDLSMSKVCEIKEEYSFVGEPAQPVVIERIIGGKPRKLDVGEEIGQACQELVELIFEGVKDQIAKANSDSVPELLQNIVVTGGGSQIDNIGSVLQKMLEDEGYSQPRVRVIGDNYKEFVARGAMKAARAAQPRQWQNLMA